MTERTMPQAPGTPTWLDFWCADPTASAGFWRDLLGYDIPPGDENFGGYTVAHKDGKYVFGIGPAMPEGPKNAGDTAQMYLSTNDVHATFAKALELGATKVADPMEIPEHGVMAVVTDPAGVLVAFWQPTGLVGYQAVDEIGFPCWQDCVSPDVERTKAFYEGLFGYTFEPMGEWLLGKLGDDGHFMLGHPEDGRVGYWISYLTVDDIDATIRSARDLGASVTTEPIDFEFGRYARLQTPGGAPFGLFSGPGSAAE